MRNVIGKKSAVLALLGSATFLGATMLAVRSLNPDSKLWVEGTSTVRDYKCVATTFESEIVTAAPAATLPLPQLVSTGQVVIPIEALDCSNGTMNEHMKKALKMKEYPRITFELGSYTIDGANAVLDGTLEMAGKTNPVRIAATVADEAAGVVRVQAVHALKMTEWGIKPPSLFLGTMKVHEEVKIHFDVTLQR